MRENLYGRTILAFLAFFVATGCADIKSSQVNQSQIFTSYSASYDASTADLRLSATFNVGGSTGTYVILDGQSQVSVNGSQLGEDRDAINQVQYDVDQDTTDPGDIQALYGFLYVDNDGVSYRNGLQLPGAIQVTLSPGSSFSRSSMIAIPWQATTTVSSSETLETFIESAGGTGSAIVSSNGGGMNGQALFEPGDLQNAGSGNFTARICRYQYGIPVEAPEVSGSTFVEYCSARVPIILTP